MPPRKPKNTDKAASNAAVIRVKQSNSRQLSKAQRAFNKLTQRIEFLQNAIAAETDKLDMLSAMHQKEVVAKMVESANLQIKLAHLLHKKRNTVKLSKANSKKLDEVIFNLLDYASTETELDEDTLKIYDSYHPPIPPQDNSQPFDLWADSFYQQSGGNTDPAHLGRNHGFENTENNVRQQFEEPQKHQNSRKKTTKQLEKEAQQAKKEALKKKSLRSIYISLVKILHPDAEPDPILKAEKEETMKNVTTAYENNDMVKLLQIEMQWVKNHQDQLANVDNDTLATYIELLKDQVKELETQRFILSMNPRYMHVAHYQSVNIYAARNDLREQGHQFSSLIRVVQASIRQLEHSAQPAAAIKNCIDEFYDQQDLPFNQDFDF